MKIIMKNINDETIIENVREHRDYLIKFNEFGELMMVKIKQKQNIYKL